MKNPRVFVIGIPLAIAILAVLVLLPPGDAPVDVQDGHPSSVSVSAGASTTEVVLPVEVSVARRGRLVKRVQTQGVVRARREVELIARVSGEVIAVFVRNGAFVPQGHLLIKLDDREYRLAYEKASTALLAAQIE